MTENDLRDQVADELLKRKGHASWVESHASSPGFPDLDACVSGVILQMELKVEKEGGAVKIRPTQFKWMKDRTKAGGCPVLMIGSDDGIYVMPGESAYDPSPLKNLRQLPGRVHWKVTNMRQAIDIALSVAIEKGATKHA